MTSITAKAGETKPRSKSGAAFRQLLQSPPAIVGAVLLSAFVIMALIGPLLAPYNPREQHLIDRLLPPAWSEGGDSAYLLGTDQLGRDVFSRLLHGSRVALSVGLFATSLALSIGVIVGLISGYYGGWFDTISMRLLEIVRGRETSHQTLATSLALAKTLGKVGVVVDVYHVWWDEHVHDLMRGLGARFFAFHVNDWLAPPPDVLLGRGMMGDGVIDLRGLHATARDSGYSGPVEVEIFNRDIWSQPGDEVMALMLERYRAHVLGER